MIPYFFIFSIPIIASLFPQVSSKKVFLLGWVSYLILVFIFLALRNNVGGDWTNYVYILNNRIENFNFLEFQYRSEYLFEFLLWIIKKLNLNIYYFFSFSSLIFLIALSKICLKQNNPWLGLVISFPLLINILSIGYTRQSIAFSFLIFAIYSLLNTKNILFFIFLIIGSLFHKSLIFFLILPIFTINSLQKKFLFSFIILFIFIIFYSLTYNEINRLVFIFLGEGIYFESKGAFLRLLFHSIISLLFLLFSSKLQLPKNELIIWRFFAIISIILFPLVFNYSSFVDRMIYYFYPLQIIFFTRYYLIFNNDLKFLSTLLTIIIYLAIYIFWIYNATHFNSWFPYNNILFL